MNNKKLHSNLISYAQLRKKQFPQLHGAITKLLIFDQNKNFMEQLDAAYIAIDKLCSEKKTKDAEQK